MMSSRYFSRRSASARVATATAVTAFAVLTLAGCSGGAVTESTSTSVQQVTSAADSVTVVDAWAKAAADGMTAGFGVLENSSADDITLEAASTAAAHMVELHETKLDDAGAMTMQQKEGGFVIPAGERFVLEPGGNHLMLMGLTAPLVAGQEVEFTLSFADGSTLNFSAPIKDYSGANETYSSDHGDGHDHSEDHDHENSHE